MIRVSYLALQAPDLSPSQRYRVEAFLPFLERRGIRVRYEWLLDRDDLRVFYATRGMGPKASIALKAGWRRLASVLHARDVDVFLVQREAFFLGSAWSEGLARRRAPIVYDFDDAIWIKTLSEANRRFSWLKNVDKIPSIVAMAHTVLAGNEYLAAWARTHSRNVHVMPTCVDTDRFRPPPRRDSGTVTIGWSGSVSTVAHLRPLLPVLERVQRRFGGVRIRVMGDPSFTHAPLGLRGEMWTPERELALLHQMDIGVMPLPEDEWTRGKCGLKGLLAMAVGAAAVMSPVGVNTTIVRHAHDGLLAHTEDEWFEALCRLIEDGELRRRLGERGRARVVTDYSVQRWEGRLAEVLVEAAGS